MTSPDQELGKYVMRAKWASLALAEHAERSSATLTEQQRRHAKTAIAALEQVLDAEA